MKQPLLSICIPTYNRGNCLNVMLNSLLPQIDIFGDASIQIVISNNASEDNTEKVIKDWEDKGFSIEYYRQSYNIGLTNLDFVLSKAKGKYILMSGDDDIYSPDFLQCVWPYLESKSEFGILHWNRLTGDKDCKNNVIFDYDYKLGIIEYSCFGDFIIDKLSSSNFLSSLIFNSKCWKVAPMDQISPKWDGYKWWGKLMLGAATLNMRCIYYYFPLVIQRNPTQRWLDRWPYYFLFELCDIFACLDNVAKGTYNAWNNRMHDSKYYDVYSALDIVKNDLTFYREHEEDMMRYLSKSEREYLRQILYNKDIEQQQRKFERKKMIKNWIKKIINVKK